MTEYIKSQRITIANAYLEMARTARYRPAAPSDGCGTIRLTKTQLADFATLAAEAQSYADRFIRQETAGSFNTGISNAPFTKARVYLIEAARNLCGEKQEAQTAIILLGMAAKEVEEALEATS